MALTSASGAIAVFVLAPYGVLSHFRGARCGRRSSMLAITKKRVNLNQMRGTPAEGSGA